MKAWMRCIFLLGSICFFLVTTSVGAVTLDDFTDGSQSLEVNPNGQGFSAVPTTSAIGGFRKLTVVNLEPAGSQSSKKVYGDVYTSGSGAFSHSQNAFTHGKSTLRWDGTNLTSDEVYPSGVIDLTHDGSDAFILNLESVDLPNATVTITIVDGTNPSKSSMVTKTLPTVTGGGAGFDFEIPFADFTGDASFALVGAITMTFNGSAVPALDLILSSFSTNGCTARIPTNGMDVYDDCGVCEGTNADKDVCNICYGDGTSCLDCAGTPFGTATNDVCGECDGDGTSCLDCAGTPHGSATVDPCGVCDGDGSSCADCFSVPNGVAVLDQCGVCGGTGQSCLDCAGTPNGSLANDICGVCGGDGKSCLDCEGVAFGSAKEDRCGVCNGDGQSCLDCTGYEISETQFILDGYAKKQERIIISLGRNLRRMSRRKKLRQFVKSNLKRAHQLQISNWTLSWTLPSVFSVCENTTFCVSTSNETVLDQYRSQSLELFNITNALVKKTKKFNPLGARERRFRKRGRNLYQKSIELSKTVPPIASDCS